MSIIFKYILRQISPPLLGAFTIGLLMLLSVRLVQILDITLDKKTPLSLIFEMLAYLIPHYLSFALPAALFLGLLFGFSRLSRDFEIDAFYSSGIGLSYLLRSILFLSCVLFILTFLVVGWLNPHGRYAYRALLHQVRNVDVLYLVEEGIFTQSGSRVFILNSFDRNNLSFSHLFLFDSAAGEGLSTVTARRGLLSQTDRGRVLEFFDGHRLKIDRWPSFRSVSEGDSFSIPDYRTEEFSRTSIPLTIPPRRLFRERGNDERELTLIELFNRFYDPPSGADHYDMAAELNRRLVTMLSVLFLPILAISFSIGRHRESRAYRFAAALILLFTYHEVIEQSSIMIRKQDTLLGVPIMWGDFVLLVIISLWRFKNIAFHIPGRRADILLNHIGLLLGYLRRIFGIKAHYS